MILPIFSIEEIATVGRHPTHRGVINDQDRHMAQRGLVGSTLMVGMKEEKQHTVQIEQDPSILRGGTSGQDRPFVQRGRDSATGRRMTPTTQRLGSQGEVMDQCQSHIQRLRRNSCTGLRPWRQP